MGREVRRVPENWVHPTHWQNEKLVYIPLLPADYYIEACKEYETGEREEKPVLTDYMPFFIETETTHYQMYETCSEGTPISPVCDSPESLAHWLADHSASTFGDEAGSLETEEVAHYEHDCRAPDIFMEPGFRNLDFGRMGNDCDSR
jgi:hypothetical protein